MEVNNLPEGIAELLVLVIEDCAQVQKAATKVLRSGLTFNPFNGPESNRDLLVKQLAGMPVVFYALLMELNGTGVERLQARNEKCKTYARWSDYFKEDAPLDSKPHE